MRRFAVLSLFLSLGLLGGARAGVPEAAASAASGVKVVAGKVERAVVHGVKVAASGVEHGAKAAAKGIERGATATGHAVKHVGHKLGLGSDAAASSASRP